MLANTRTMLVLLAFLLACSAQALRPASAAENDADLAAFAVKASGADKGLCLVIDPDGAGPVAALAKASRLYVQGIVWDAKRVDPARKDLAAAGLAARGSVAFSEANHLPYADNLINLVVCANWGRTPVPLDEVVRVLAPGGMALLGPAVGLEAKLKAAGVTEVKAAARKDWIQFVKPEPKGYGTWTNNHAGPDLSQVGDDEVAGPWTELRWIGDPRWGALAGTYSGRVSGGGRFYYAESRSDGAWWIARDAYNGTELWRVPLEGKGWVPLWGPGNTLACDERWAYATHKGALIARDGKSGEIVKEYKCPIAARTISPVGEFLLVNDVAKNICNAGSAVVLDKAQGRVVWTRPAVSVPPASDSLAFVLGPADLEAVEIATGTTRWKTPFPKLEGATRLSYKAGLIYAVTQPNWKPISQLTVFDAKDGKQLWTDTERCAKSSTMLPCGPELCFMMPAKPQKIVAVDGRTGKVLREMPVNEFSGKCYGFTGSAHFFSYGWGEWLDIQKGDVLRKQTLRSACFLGGVFANGLTYFLPHHCDCGVTLRGLLAMSGDGKRAWLTDANKEGAAKLYPAGAPAAPLPDGPDDWPMFRRTTQRANAVPSAPKGPLKQAWSVKLGEAALTQAVSAYGLVCLAEPKAHRVFARDAATGQERWTFAADGRVDFPPALHKGLCLFGTSGGSVYALDARSGREVWRLRAAPAEKYIGEEGQFASSWPVIGGVMPLDGVIYFTCGRSVNVDGGMWIFAVDALTGAVKWRVKGGSTGDFFRSEGTKLYLTRVAYRLANGEKVLGNEASVIKGLLRTTYYLAPVSVADYMACVEASLSSEKHVELTDGVTTGECLAFGEKLGVAAWRNRFGVPADLMKKDKKDQRFLYARGADGKLLWRSEDGLKQQFVGMVLAGESAVMAGVPVSKDASEKGELWVVDASNGTKTQVLPLDARPVYDGLSAAGGRYYMATEDGRLICFAP
ncbi:MAG: PQQ-binding-like beta-propeller repeat protein [Planctomycetota bacterium]|nr:PQQ-binding-like beta-propeller repeat protein [Planctomycetota bacterium]